MQTKTFEGNPQKGCGADAKQRIKKKKVALHSKNVYIMKIEHWKTDVKVGRQYTTKTCFNRSDSVGVCWLTHL